MKKRRVFIFTLSVLLALNFITAGLISVVLQSSGIAFVRFPDGTVMLGDQTRAAETRPSIQPPITVPVGNPPSQKPDPDGALTFAGIYKKAVPSVTAIISEGAYASGSGTGIIITEDGYILTNNHVVEGARGIKVILHDGGEYSADLIGNDRLSDLAVIKIKASGLTPAEFGDSDAMEHGDPVAAIGNPLGIELRNTITAGIISGVNRDITLEDSGGDITMTVLQTNCAVNPGNSGGPLLNEYGQVIGIISSKIMGSASSTVEGLGFAIPSNTAAPLVTQLIEYGYIRGRPALGITIELTYRPTAFMPPGVCVDTVNERSDAYTKLQKDDIITHVNGTAVSSVSDINEIKNKHKAGDSLKLTIWRYGDILTVDVRLMEEGDTK
ncbi:MAG: trypsin-like peptidase domain-containing protein [Oscillospiraceae bacterium]|nr:trypsin-like peptidase domain-containing protein [Oscillospiraceae bacterium]